MKLLLAFALVNLIIAATATTDKEWKDFKTNHGKKYKTTEDEAKARKNFDANHKLITEHNSRHVAGKSSFTLGHNHLSDLDNHEFQRTRCTAQAVNVQRLLESGEEIKLNSYVDVRQIDTIDYSTDFCMTPVKDQGQCGSCYAFSAVAALEYYNCKKSGIKKILSEQQFVDCSSDSGNFGCGGGSYARCYNYVIKQALGVACNDSYPYTATAQTCQYTPSMNAGTVTSYKWSLPQGDESAMMTTFLAAQGPVNVALNAGQSTFQLYKSGVYDDEACPTTVNHAVLLVGYGSLDDVPYWKIKNSWGTRWGSSGYMYVRRGVNRCAIANQVLYPTV